MTQFILNLQELETTYDDGIDVASTTTSTCNPCSCQSVLLCAFPGNDSQ